MALMDAKEYDPRPARRRKTIAVASVLLLTVFVVLWFWPSGRFRYHRQWSIANRFFVALERRDFDTAYGLYNSDLQWKQHPAKYPYTISQFTADWGGGASNDLVGVTNHRIMCIVEPRTSGPGAASGLAVVTELNHDKRDPEVIWIEKQSATITLSPLKFDSLARNSPFVLALCK